MIQLSIVTPAGKYFEDKVESIAVPGLEGGLEVYSGHMAIVCALKSGRVRLRREGRDFKSFSIDSGILEVDPNHHVLLLADQITDGDLPK